MFGSHLSIAGGMVNALDQAERLGLDTVQVFTKNQQQWKVPPLDPEASDAWLAALNRLGWAGRTVSHASYLINLASVNDELRTKSVDLMIEEVERCERLHIAFLVHHPGSHVGGTLDVGIANITRSYAEILKRTKGYRTVLCLEGTAGGGSLIGGAFEHLRDLRAGIIETTGESKRVGFCLDTCHMHAAGYDLSTRAKGDDLLRTFDAICGIEHVRVLHINDSKGKVGSKLDRHEHIGAGDIGRQRPAASGFASFMTKPEFTSIPKILETPKGNDDQGRDHDTVNLRVLRRLAGVSTPTKRRRVTEPS